MRRTHFSTHYFSKQLSKSAFIFNKLILKCCFAAILMIGFFANANAQCPTIFMDDLRGVPGYPEVNEVTVCGVPDTISMYINNTSGQVLSFSELTLNVPLGYEYAGDFGFFDPSYPVAQGNVSDPNNPEFTLAMLGADSVQIVWFTITATCDIYTLPPDTEFFFGATFDFFIGATPCTETWTGLNDYGLYTRRPSLNILSVSPVAASITTADERCSNITIKQTGIDASITEFDFEIDGVELAPDFDMTINIGGVNVPYTYNPGTMEVDAVIDDTYFSAGTLDEDETVVVQVCYIQLLDCDTRRDIIDVTYKASFGCGDSDEPCTDPSIAEGNYRYAPNFQNAPQITSTTIQTPQICGDNAIFELTFVSNQTDSLKGLIRDFEGGIQVCAGDAFEAVSAMIVGGAAFPATDLYFDGTYFMASSLNFTTDPDGPGGLSDADGDGFFDDIVGGDQVTIRFEAAIKCQDGGLSGCASIDCEANSAKVKGLRNCDAPFNLNRAITPTVFSYGSTSTTVNPDTIGNGIVTFDFGVSSASKTVDVEFCYEFGSNGVTGCGNSDIYFELDLTGAPALVSDMELEMSTVMYDGTPVPATDVSVTYDTLVPDNKVIRINAGDAMPTGQVCYSFDITIDSCICYSRRYVGATFNVVEVCNDCTPDACTIVRACEQSTFSAVRNCMCECFIQSHFEEVRRTDYGYTDATMTTPVDTSTISTLDKKRFLPCDSVYVHAVHEILDGEKLSEGHRLYIYNFAWSVFGRYHSPGLELLPHYSNSRVAEFSFEKASNPGVRVPVDLTGGCNSGNQSYYQYRGGQSTVVPGATHIWPNNDTYDARDNEGVYFLIMNRETEFANGSPTAATGECLTELETQMAGFEDGDKFHVRYAVPLQKNPYRMENADIAAKPKGNLNMYSYGAVYQYVSGTFTNQSAGCQTPMPIELYCPDTLKAVTDINATSCDATVTHTIEMASNADADWYPNEYRPIYHFDSISLPLTTPFAYGSNLMATYAGNPVALTDPTFDDASTCVYDPVSASNCCTPSGASSTMLLDPTEFPEFGIGLGGATPEKLVITYDLKKICPGSVPEPTDYDIGLVYSLPCSFQSEGYHCNYHSRPAVTPLVSFFGDPSQTWPIPECNGGGPGTTGYNTPKFDEKDYHLDTLYGKSLNYMEMASSLGPLACTIQKDFVGDASGASEFNTYEVCASGAGTHMNVVTSINVPLTVDLINVTDGNGNPVTWSQTGTSATANTYYVQTPDLSAGDCFEIIIETELLFCPTEDLLTEVCISSASGCLSPELTSQLLAGGGDACTSATCCYEYTAGEAEIQNTWETAAPKYADLCDTVHLEILIKNVKDAILTNLETQIVLPAGLTYIPGSFEYVYPGISGAPGVGMSDPTGGGTSPYGPASSIFDVSVPPILQNGFPGILAPAGDNLLIYRFVAETNCDEYVSNTPFYVKTDADDPCEQRINSGWIPHPGIIVNGADPADFAQFVINMDPIDYVCGGPVPVSFSAVNLSTTGGVSNNTTTCMTFPPSLLYTPGSFVFTSPGAFTPTNVTETAQADGSVEVCFDVPDGLNPQQSFAGTVELEVDPSVECGEVLVEALIMSELDSIICVTTGMACPVFVNNSINQYLVLEINPPIQMSEVELIVACDEDPLNATLDYMITVEADSTPYSGPVTFEFVYDIDQNGMIDSYDQTIYTGSSMVNVGAGMSEEITGSIGSVAEEFTCPLLVKMTIDPNCACDSQVFEYTGPPKPDFLAGLTDPLIICPGEVVSLITCSNYSFEYLMPASLGTVTPDSRGELLLGGYPSSPVQLAVTGGTGGCDTTWVIEIIQLDDFTLADGSAIVCNLECTTLDAGIPEEWLGAVSVSWSPGTYLDDSTSATPMICNPDASIVYTVTVTNPADCDAFPTTIPTQTFGAGNCCTTTATFSVNVLTPPIPDIICDAKYGECYFPEDPPTITVLPAGSSNYDFYYSSTSGGPAVLVQSGTSNVHIAANITGYYTAIVLNGICSTPVDTVFKMALPDCCELAMTDPNAFCCIITDSTMMDSPLATWDCDMGGVDNITECLSGGNPGDSDDDCQIAAEEGMDICAELDPDGDGVFDETHPWATQDCDGGGVSNIDECIAGTDPSDPSDDPTCPCHDAEAGTIDICAILAVDPTNPIGTLDCDEGGVDNLTECEEGGDPLDPADDCDMAEIAEVDICALIAADPMHPMASLDCDGGGVLNIDECNAGEDPFDPMDDCDAAIAENVNICVIVLADPMGPLALADCDDGGVNNYQECINGGDPSDPADDCESAGAAGVSICAVLDPDGDGTFDPTHPWATMDCDGGGVDNITECITGDDPSNPSDDPQCACDEAEAGTLDICALLALDPDNPIGTLDCDEGGVDNATECANGGNPIDPADDCDMWQHTGIDLCILLAGDPMHPLASVDCDGGGVSNIEECDSGEDPFDPADDCESAINNELDICAIVLNDPMGMLATQDCDEGGVNNIDECQNGGDPADPADDCEAASEMGVDICAILAADPMNPWGTLDCDGGGVSNADECIAGTDPNDPADDPTCACHDAEQGTIDICAILVADPMNSIGTLDCDEGGIDNATECAEGGDPLDPEDDCLVAEVGDVDICAIIAADPMSPMADLDCDGGGVSNADECNAGEDPFDPADDCDAAIAEGVDICVIVLADPTGPLALADCDEGGVNNIEECQNGGDPADPADDCDVAADTGVDICALIAADPMHPWGTLDCDGGGVSNADECIAGTDPNDPADDPTCGCHDAEMGTIDICGILAADPTNPIGTLDCDEGGVDNATECAEGGDPLDPADDCDLWQATGIDLCVLLAGDPTHPLASVDCDGGGVSNIDECASGEDPFDPADDCQAAIDGGVDICAIVLNDPTGPLALADCDEGGVNNIEECQNGGDPADPADDCDVASTLDIDICALIAADPMHPWGTLDCDGGGVSNADECIAGTDPNDPADDPTCGCHDAEAGTIDICAILAADPTNPIGTEDCDEGGVDNATECAEGNDPLDPADDCDLVNDGTVDVCAILVVDPMNPLGSEDCDGGGVDNATECAEGNDPSDPLDDCEVAIAAGVDICAIVLNDPTGPLAMADCDEGGVNNIEECMNGGDPADSADDCDVASTLNIDICAILAADPTHPWGTLDCDGGGVSNADECIAGTDPNDPADDPTCACHDAEAGTIDICAILAADPLNPLGTLDCDDGGVDNATECANGDDPLDPADDCDLVNDGTVDVCMILTADPMNPLGSADCDGGGVSNADECANGGDPSDPGDDCDIAIAGGLDICLLIGSDPMHPLATLDCDNGGANNYDECTNGGDPSDPADDCDVAANTGADICAALDPDGDGTFDTTHPWATLDCDGGGIDNITECMNGDDPSNPSDDMYCPCDAAAAGDIDICAVIAANPNSPIGTLDCDEGGADNATECANGGDPNDPADDCDVVADAGLDICVIVLLDPTSPLATVDCDGGGVSNYDECITGEDPTDPADDCQAAEDGGLDLCALIGADPTHPMATQDCDGGGVNNYDECANGGDPMDPGDDCDVASTLDIDICAMIAADPTHPWATLDCDGGGVSNADECIAGTDPNDPADDPTCGCHDAEAGNIDICAILAADPMNTIGTLDCDEGGVDNATECANGNDPLDPADECDLVNDGTVDVCMILSADPMNPLGSEDCDNGGVTNADECSNGGNPSSPADDCDVAINGGLDICVLIGADPMHPLSQLDCDNGGANNYDECMNGGDPSDPADDCEVAADTGIDICAILASNPAHPWGTLDCDGGGVSNADECAAGDDPSDPGDDNNCRDLCLEAETDGTDICVLLASNPTHPLSTLDCDNGGMDNETECANGGDPNDPADDCDVADQGGVNICVLILVDPTHPMASQDCDGGGVLNIDECNTGEDPFDPADDCQAAIDGGLDICAIIGWNSTHPLATADCDGGGVDNYTECQNGHDPADPADDCEAAVDGEVDICAILTANPTHPMSTMDCDNGGIDNETECASGEDPLDPADDCQTTIDEQIDICALINGDPNHPLATADCDNGGAMNIKECYHGQDPSNPTDDCATILDAEVDICAIILVDPSHPLSTQDCDNGGIINIIECNNGDDPTDPSDDFYCNAPDPCDELDGSQDICVILADDPSHPLATADCDKGGVDNQTECDNGGDPSNPADECAIAIAGGVDLCAIIGGDPTHPMATLDCDEGGVPNIEECYTGEDPLDPADDCQAAIDGDIDVCDILINPDGTYHPMATMDCDNGGVPNINECLYGYDPEDASDECEAALGCGLDICVLIGGDPNHPLADLDCDGGGIDNHTECQNGGDPGDPSDDCFIALEAEVDICVLMCGDPTHPMATQDCDGGGMPNHVECTAGTDPINPEDDCIAAIETGVDVCTMIALDPTSPYAGYDCDNGGIDNGTECANGGDPADPTDDCLAAIATGEDVCAIINGDPAHPMASLDCDDGGIDNYTECSNGTDPADPSDDCSAAKAAGINICILINYDPAHPLAQLDCDNGGVTNIIECMHGEDPCDPLDDCGAAVEEGMDICAMLAADPSHPWASLDCDRGGVDNATECANAGDPTDPIDDQNCTPDLCTQAADGTIDICALLAADASHPVGTLDCDGGGVMNAVECSAGADPLESSDDCSAAETAQLDVCAMILADPTHPLAAADCDGGGVANAIECGTGSDLFDATDDCQSAIDSGVNICQLINFDATHPLASLDCDAGGVDNITECNSGGDPSDPSDDTSDICLEAMDGNSDICAMLTADPTHPIGAGDCDNGGVTNLEECQNNNDPTDGLDDCPDLTPITTILPGNIAGVSGVGVAVEITELNGIDTDGSPILVRMPSDPRLTFVWNPTLTSVALTAVNNANWTYLGNNGVVHTFQYNGPSQVILGRQTEAFGFQSTYDPQATDGQTTVTASIVPFGGGECNILNDTDSERLVYFE